MDEYVQAMLDLMPAKLKESRKLKKELTERLANLLRPDEAGVTCEFIREVVRQVGRHIVDNTDMQLGAAATPRPTAAAAWYCWALVRWCSVLGRFMRVQVAVFYLPWLAVICVVAVVVVSRELGELVLGDRWGAHCSRSPEPMMGAQRDATSYREALTLHGLDTSGAVTAVAAAAATLGVALGLTLLALL